ncbi:hypothetical protein A3C96_00165 [Candidatus Uhrbacteria bacterium RIFCSPHIGHO2_02_FULL_60_10]|uniref:DUF721 domain-containing protein n=1 Tax=Candidatus Uhrbacteria bacterium RIFCSPHIGHO2_02_FULL_60_10 TaxID=1802392 RepID=A0A1F7U6U8_9BACT|nr:MAG: hypothetical protein A3C96_00165 [Candidatus Uhrbacteria bacterium RIFCSPHIGHO2_02_FULL_60_10]
MESIKNLLPKNIRPTEAVRQVQAAAVIRAADEILKRTYAVGATRIRDFREGLLSVQCHSAALAQDMMRLERGLCRRINQRLGTEEVRSIRATG